MQDLIELSPEQKENFAINKGYKIMRISSKDFKNFADMLGVSEADLKTALSKPSARKELYRKLSIKFHPDKNLDNNVAGEIFKIIQNSNLNPAYKWILS